MQLFINPTNFFAEYIHLILPMILVCSKGFMELPGPEFVLGVIGGLQIPNSYKSAD